MSDETEVLEEHDAPIESDEEPEGLDEATLERRREALAQVVKFGDPVLRSRASEVTEFDEALIADLARMVRIMHDAMGVGLAATQLGILRRALVFQAGPDAPATALVNPQIEWTSEEEVTAEEGCLSIPGIVVDVERPLQARVTGLAADGEPIEIEASGLEARVLQHEIDHLDGVLMLSHAPRAAQGGAARAARGRDLLAAAARRGRGFREPRGRLRTAYLGTSEFAAAVLRRLADSPHRPALVVTPPDRPQGRGRKVAPPPRGRGGQGARPRSWPSSRASTTAALERIRAAKPEAVVVCAFGQLIREPLLSEFPMLNVHPSLLPRWRGAAPIERAIMAGDERTGVTIMRLTEGLDSGPVALQEEIAVKPGEDFSSLSGRLADLGGELLVAALDQLEKGMLDFADQDDDGATYAEKIDPAERRLDPARPATELERVVRALAGHVGAYLEIDDGERLGSRPPPRSTPARPRARSPRKGRAPSSASAGCVRLDTVKSPGGRAMSAKGVPAGHEPPGRPSERERRATSAGCGRR